LPLKLAQARLGHATLAITADTYDTISGFSTRSISLAAAGERIIRRYVARGAATKDAVRQLNEARKRT
jgi:hypothetical protein